MLLHVRLSEVTSINLNHRLPAKLFHEGLRTTDIIKVVLIENEPTTRKRCELHEKLRLLLCWTTHTYAVCETWCGPTTIGICYLSLSMVGRCLTI